uniref:G-type lectin S-receptor-like serine/threonine-protein kinase LECRK1 n=1 Tax=Erigeron canadensis TaxID=72917 RepID=UPI001CB8B64A|nr:G-type lectin S-receptor-like serine/threonine-protein kinase LECRK1 [Erigeron canadensis]
MSPLLFVFLFLLFFQTSADGGSGDTIKLGSSLVAGAQSGAWYSQSGLFAFGFHPQGSGYVVAIWLVSIDENTVVWTENRDHPPVSPDATLELTNKGELVLLSVRSSVNKTIAANISFAVMTNSGNFVLHDRRMNVVWQSFDYPTDTMLPGQLLSGGCELVSSVSKTNYSSGRFRIKMQIDGNLVMYPVNTEEVGVDSYWATDTVINNSKYYLYLNDTGLLLMNGSSSNIIMDLYSKPPYPLMYRATLGDDGIFRLYFYNRTNSPPSIVWKTPDRPCDVKNFCGLNSYCTMDDERPYCVCLPGSDFIDHDQNIRGCERNFTKAWCKNGKENVTYYNMVPKEQLVWIDHPYYQEHMEDNTRYKEDCSKSCLEDCDCDAALWHQGICEKHKFPLRYVRRVFDDELSTGFFKTSTVSFNFHVNESSNTSYGDVGQGVTTRKKTWALILVISIGFSIYCFISLSLSGFFIFKFRLLKYKKLLESRMLGFAEDLILRSYTLNELRKATNGFKQELGRGSFGRVYKGCIYKGKKTIAVKRLEKVVDEGEREFRAEMQVIGKTHHKNLVRLLGYCAEGKSERLLVYEYMSNGTLADHLFKSERLPEWCERVQIALDVARGILYLHEECETPIIHCDIKPQNILMDDFWTAKISDFGLAKLLMPDQTKTFTMVRGTRGYLAPEWQKNIPISVKVDVFSYGIVLLEIICCRRNLEVRVSDPDEIVLSTWVYKCFERGQLDLLVDLEEVEKETLERLVKVGLWCIQDDPAIRPSMKCVLLMLEGITPIANPPCPTST